MIFQTAQGAPPRVANLREIGGHGDVIPDTSCDPAPVRDRPRHMLDLARQVLRWKIRKRLPR